MFCKATLLTVALALIASASPIARDSQSGIHVPLHKRGSLKKSDGSFDYAKAAIQFAKVQNKHRQNLINLQRNKGFLSDSLYIPKPVTLSKRQALPLTDEQNGLEWMGTVSIGTPATDFAIDFDTGSADLWIPSSSCSGCGSHSTYNPSSSSTSKSESGTFQISYGDGSTASGPEYTDTVSLSGVTVTGQALSAVTSESGEFQSDPADGLMGLAFQSISQLQSSPFPFTASSEGVISQGVFAFKLTSSGAELYMGGTDSSLYSGDIEYHDLSSSDGFWQIGGASAIVNGQTATSGFDTVIDSGTTLAYGPTSGVSQLYAAIPGSQQGSDGTYTFPCDSSATVGFSWGGQTWQIDPSLFNQGTSSSDSSQCVGAIGASDNLGLGSNTWLLGDIFMSNVYTAFSIDQNAVGFAALA
ncbi:Aspartic protease [Sparassis crispa]|uniref:Aspartic protease n=1 Tax=Sparassis crispa TaxID=139825 RepID=A0A401GLM3_9APHY|nr:Aspartic protease [Sparassis crispa]GBE83078.1 Aspartic protease [Sparassis crispa]